MSIVDWSDTARNDWLALNQFSVQGPKLTRRPYVVLFIDGLPVVVVVELKNPGDENADLWTAFNQLQAYKEDIPDLFHSNALLVISDGIEARVGSLTADPVRYTAWRTIDGASVDPLGAMKELETLVHGLFRRERLLNYLRHFILVQDDGPLVKKVAGYHQLHAVRAVVESMLVASSPKADAYRRGKGGAVSHTQGPGKSIEMTCLAAELLRETPVQADTRPRLRELLSHIPSRGIVSTTIQKFTPGEDEDSFPVLSERHNIAVICDKADRSQYGFQASLDGKAMAVAISLDLRAPV